MRETSPPTNANRTGAQLLHRPHLIPPASNSRQHYKTRSTVASGVTTAAVPSTSATATATASDEEDFCGGGNGGGSRDGDEEVEKERHASTGRKQSVCPGKVRLSCVALFHHCMESNLSRIYFVKTKGVLLRIVPHIQTQSSLPCLK